MYHNDLGRTQSGEHFGNGEMSMIILPLGKQYLLSAAR